MCLNKETDKNKHDRTYTIRPRRCKAFLCSTELTLTFYLMSVLVIFSSVHVAGWPPFLSFFSFFFFFFFFGGGGGGGVAVDHVFVFVCPLVNLVVSRFGFVLGFGF